MAAYALSPIDLIPVLGYLDDVIIVPLGILLAVRLVPGNLMAEYRAASEARQGRPVSRSGLVAIIVIWILLAAWAIWLGWRFLAAMHPYP